MPASAACRVAHETADVSPVACYASDGINTDTRRRNLWRDNRYTTRTVHSLVAEAFIGPCPEGMEVRHRNGDQTNSRLSNLTYGTHADNMQDAIRHGTNPHSAQTHCKNDHPFSNANTGTGKRGDGHTFRVCRACSRDRNNAYKQRKAAPGAL